MPGRSGKSVQVDVETWEKLMKLKIKYKKSVKDIIRELVESSLSEHQESNKVFRNAPQSPGIDLSNVVNEAPTSYYTSLYSDVVARNFWSKLSQRVKVSQSMTPYKVEYAMFRKIIESLFTDIDVNTVVDVLESSGYISVEKNHVIINKPTT